MKELAHGFKDGLDRERTEILLNAAKEELMYGWTTLPNGEIVRHKGKMKTGSIFTTLVNSATSYILLKMIATKSGLDTSFLRFLVYGDDSVITNTRPDIQRFDIELWCRVSLELTGMTMKPSQTFMTNLIRTEPERHEVRRILDSERQGTGTASAVKKAC